MQPAVFGMKATFQRERGRGQRPPSSTSQSSSLSLPKASSGSEASSRAPHPSRPFARLKLARKKRRKAPPSSCGSRTSGRGGLAQRCWP
eukprot:970793-Alexandrium_andersonii.AAC.1